MDFIKLYSKYERVVKERLNRSPRCHDWEHTQRVIHNVELLLEYEKDVDRDIAILGALFHDIARADEIAIKGKECHAARGAVITEELLTDGEGLSDEKKIKNCKLC